MSAAAVAAPWAVLPGMPVPARGVPGHGALPALAVAGLQPHCAADRRVAALPLALATGAFAFSLCLTYIEAYVIQAGCRWCIVSAVVATLLFVASLFELPRLRRRVDHG